MENEQERPRNATREALIAAAAEGFNRDGYEGVNSNTIARAAGFAPQTFYRHFKDKLAIFVAVYETWEAEERTALEAVFASPPAQGAAAPEEEEAEAAEILLTHHARWAVFRRALRALTAQPGAVRAARAAARRRQAARLSPEAPVDALASVLEIEALCDAYADGMLQDFGIDRVQWSALIAGRLRRARRAASATSSS